MRPLLFGIGVGIAVQAWRNFPSEGVVTPHAAMLVSVVGIVAGYLVGRARRRPNVAVAVASAEATATAVNHVNVAVVIPGHGAGSSDAARRVPGAGMPWIAGDRPALSADDFDGMSLEDFESVTESERSSEALESN